MDAARATTLPLAELAVRYTAEQQRIRESFALSADGAACVVARSLLADQTVIGAWNNCFRANCKGVALLAVGGYGRGQLFPFSDVDLLVLVKNAAAEKRFAESARGLSQSLWDMNFRLSISTRTVDECERLSPDNSEFTLALLDARPLCGDPELLTQFMQKSLPAMMQRERNALQRRTAELTRVRHEKYGDTMFHLEPNLKDGPGGMRDLHVCRWLARIQSAAPAANSAADLNEADAFLTSARCFLHYRAGRDDNTLYWQAQDEAAAAGIGISRGGEPRTLETAAWMRAYFRHARNVQRSVAQLLDEAENSASSIYQQVRRWRTPAKSSDYLVRNGQISSRAPLSAQNAAQCFDLFRAVAVEGLPLSRATEESILDLLPFVAMQLPSNEELWVSFQFLLQAPYAGRAFRAMHALGVLELVLPEFHGIDALVIRDAYHRYTVDEHTFVVLDSLHRMARPARQKDDDTRWHDLLKELDRPELLYFAALMHDTGKGRSGQEHTRASAALAESALLRFGADDTARAMVDQLIIQHLEMSAALRRDIFDTETVRAFCQKVGTQEILKMLTLLTYADIQSVHPDALTHWKADAIWQLYIASSNYLDRSLDEERVEGDMNAGETDAAHVTRVMLSNQDQGVEILKFLGGLPRRYLRTRSAEELRSHFAMANALQGSSVSLMTRPLDDSFEVTVITRDRPYLFSDVAGALAAQGMNIVKADAFANNAGIVVDTFRFSDPYATLRENPTEIEVFESKLKDVVTGTTQVGDLLKARMQARRKRPRKRTLEHSLAFDNTSSSHSTLLHVVAQDTPGLLYTLTRALAEHDCNIGVALVDTEGEQAIDVFYLTVSGAKLGTGLQQQIYAVLDAALRHL